MIAASNRLRAHLHALVSRGVQDGLFFRNRAVHGSAAAAVPTDFYRGPVLYQHDHPSAASIPYPRQQSEPWNPKEGAAWRAGGRAGGGAVGFRRYGGPAGPPNRTVRDGGGGGSSSSQQNPPLPFSGLNMGSRPGQKSARLRGWRWGQGDGDGEGAGEGAGSNRGGESDAGSVRGGESDARASDDGNQPTSNHSGSVDGSPTREGARGGELAGEGGPARDGKGKGKGRQQGNAAPESSTSAVGESPDVSARRSSGQVPAGPGRKGHKRRSSGRRRASKTEPWVLDLSNSGREDEQRRGGGSGAELSSPQPGYGGARRGRAVEESGWFRWHGGENRMFRPLQREEGGRFSDGRHPSNVSEDGSWEGTVDWWPRPRSPPPVGAGDAYYTPGDYDSGKPSGMFMNPFPGPPGTSSLLPAVPTFEESGTRVSWADYRGHSLAEVSRVPRLFAC